MQALKLLFLLTLINCGCQSAIAQVDSGVDRQAESTRAVPQQRRIIKDTFRTIAPAPARKRNTDSGEAKKRVDTAKIDSVRILQAQLLRDSVHADSLRKLRAVP